MSPKKGLHRVRPWLVLALFVGTWAVGHALGLDAYLDGPEIRAMVADAGVLGLFLFLGLFTVGQLLQVPGMVFVAASAYVYGPFLGAVVGFVGAILAVSVSFVVIRGIGGRALEGVERPMVKRALARLDATPVRAVAVLRLFFWMAPFVNYALAMTGLRFRHYFVGSCVGLIPPVVGASILFGWAFR